MEDVVSEGLWVTRDGQRFPLREMSDGFRTVAALVVDILKQIHHTFGDTPFTALGENTLLRLVPGVVIIDEIDAHLHVSWQRRIGPWLTAHFPHIQFIVTTHSPYIWATTRFSPTCSVSTPPIPSGPSRRGPSSWSWRRRDTTAPRPPSRSPATGN
ncbi:AAA family ATPase [Streptomyces sp. NPDC088812]|uniref:AAA family ATPase n=1 Tax=Streptomyces sp. NPDC088812 TaxID=3365905 RepID=UPI0038181B49